MDSAAMPRRIMVTGAEGMLGADLCTALRAAETSAPEVTGLDLPDFDITDVAACRKRIQELQPDCVIHCAGYTNVEGCTRDPMKAFAVNADGTRNVAEVAEGAGAQFVYISTDYVFDGTKSTPYNELDTPSPINLYGESKLLGEEYVRDACGRWQIIRTQWLFGQHGTNFVTAIIAAARRDGSVRAVSDQIGSPTYTKDLAHLICEALTLPTGIYHATNSGSGSWCDVASVAFEAAGLSEVELTPILASEWPSETARPACSVLENAALAAAGVELARPWADAVRDFVGTEIGA